MKQIFLLLLLLLLLFSWWSAKAQKENKIDSLVIKMDLDPGSGPDYNIIKIYFNKHQFHVKYQFYENFDDSGYKNDPNLTDIEKEFKLNKEKINQSIRDKLNKIRYTHTKFYIKELTLKNKNYKNYFSQVNNVSKISQQDVENEKNKNASYIHGVGVSFYFYEGLEKKKLVASALGKDNFTILYYLLINTLDLYRNKMTDKSFNSKTFGY